MKRDLFPPEVDYRIIRNYGQTANAKINNLVSSLLVAVLTVVIFIGIILGWRAALVVGLAVPICYGVTLALDLLAGYSINRVSLFALILALGLLVDDPITGVDNIERHLAAVQASRRQSVIAVKALILPPARPIGSTRRCSVLCCKRAVVAGAFCRGGAAVYGRQGIAGVAAGAPKTAAQ